MKPCTSRGIERLTDATTRCILARSALVSLVAFIATSCGPRRTDVIADKNVRPPGAPQGSVASKAAAHFEQEVKPILTQYCWDCHGDGMNKGKVAFDEFKSPEELLGNRDLWFAALKNLRAGLMPPEKKPRPSAEEIRKIETWVKGDVFGIDPKDPDPGRVTIRRLNRVEYRNTIHDLMGYDYKVEEELPPDDTGYGFDNIGDVLTVSPLLLEKYMQAAEIIVAAAVPRMAKVIPEKQIYGVAGGRGQGMGNANRFTFYEEAKVSRTFKAEHPGSYKVGLDFEVLGQFQFDPGKCNVVLKIDDAEVWQQEFPWQPGIKSHYDVEGKWEPGDRKLVLELHPLTPVEKKMNTLDLRITSVRVQGPLEEQYHVRPKSFDLFFTRDVPNTPAERRDYAREVLRRFATKAFRRPIDDKSLDRLVAIAESAYNEPGKRFEDGVAQAIIPVLASPRFLFRVEEAQVAAGVAPGGKNARTQQHSTNRPPSPGGKMPPSTAGRMPAATHPFVDEYSLASRLSYFLWSTMPDEELFRLAQRGELRKNLDAQVKRILADSRSQELIENFVGQWLQVRDVDGIDINSRVVLARDSGEERGGRGGFFQGQGFRRLQELRNKANLTPQEQKEFEKLRTQIGPRFNRPTVELDRDLRRALRQETEMCFGYVVREDHDVLELIDADYTFLNERLAKHYNFGITNLDENPFAITNITGTEMRRVTLPKGSPRGGILTHGSVLIVTSNPTRTSPVKRGLFVLDNILGTPTPPPPEAVPPLEDAEQKIKDKKPTLREALELHREDKLCASCHNRMDPLGLALENFNALGLWREKERGQPIDAAGKLITGETFSDVRDVKRTLVTNHRLDFYRCLTEKLLTYALGRGLEYYDVEAVDQIVERLDKENGRFSALLMGIVESAPFQKRRNPSAVTELEPVKPVQQRAEAKVAK